LTRRIDALAIAFLAVLTAAAAKPARDPLVGDWAFKTAGYGPGCMLEGQMEIRQAENAKLACAFEARETCRPWKVRARQTCSVTRAPSGDITLRSAVVSTDSESYHPDDFTVRMLRPDEMRGTMSSVYEAPVVFSRKAALTS
jgi:hypothetical protein